MDVSFELNALCPIPLAYPSFISTSFWYWLIPFQEPFMIYDWYSDMKNECSLHTDNKSHIESYVNSQGEHKNCDLDCCWQWDPHELQWEKVFHFKCDMTAFFLEPLDLVIIMKPCRINGKIFEWILISRRSCFRAGVRYYVRGNKILHCFDLLHSYFKG